MPLQNLQVEFIESLLSETANSHHVQHADALCIYSNNYQSALMNALESTYPLILKLVGQDFFRQLAQQYIHKYPSLSSNLHDYGAYFCDFVAEYEPCYDLIYLPEVARFEWASHAIYFAGEHAPLSISALENIAPAHYPLLHFSLHPACQLHKFHYPILQIIDLCKGLIQETVDIDAGGVNLLMLRQDHTIRLIPLSESEYVFLTQLEKGAQVGVALTESLRIDPNFKLDEKLLKWVNDKVIVDFHFISDDGNKQTRETEYHSIPKEGNIEPFTQ